jgi:hypothetical protein
VRIFCSFESGTFQYSFMKYVFSGNALSPTRKPFFVGFGHPKYTKKWTKLVWLRFFLSILGTTRGSS